VNGSARAVVAVTFRADRGDDGVLGDPFVLVGAALPGVVRGSEVDFESGIDLQLDMLGELFVAIPSQRSTELVGHRGEPGRERG